MAQQPVEAGADQHDDVGFLEDEGAGRGCRLGMGIGQQALRHAHGQIGNAGLLDQCTDIGVGLGVGGALTQDDQGFLGALQQSKRAIDGLERGDLARRRVDDLDQRPLTLGSIDRLAEQLGRQVEIDAAGTPGNRRPNRPCDANADVLGMQDAIGRLADAFGDGELIHLLVIALLQIDDLALG
jgi:hypothetical protein